MFQQRTRTGQVRVLVALTGLAALLTGCVPSGDDSGPMDNTDEWEIQHEDEEDSLPDYLTTVPLSRDSEYPAETWIFIQELPEDWSEITVGESGRQSGFHEELPASNIHCTVWNDIDIIGPHSATATDELLTERYIAEALDIEGRTIIDQQRNTSVWIPHADGTDVELRLVQYEATFDLDNGNGFTSTLFRGYTPADGDVHHIMMFSLQCQSGEHAQDIGQTQFRELFEELLPGLLIEPR